jgi:DNA-binding NtrC family response regulator
MNPVLPNSTGVALLMPTPMADVVTKTLEGMPYSISRIGSLAELKKSMTASAEFCAAILDIDTFKVTDSDLRELVQHHPRIALFCVSSQRVHPHLRQAMGDTIFACLSSPIQPEELRFLLAGAVGKGVDR